MNKQYKIMIGLLLCLGLSGCSKHFLDEKSQDEVKPSTVTELQELLMGEVYPAGQTNTSFLAYLDLMTDDMTSNFNPDDGALGLYNFYGGPFTWQADMYETMAAAGKYSAIDTYEHYYRRILGCNAVLDLIDKVRGEADARENVRGQALAMRAYFYFMLVNIYGQPYNAKGVDISTSPGVELMLSSTVHDDYPKRESVARIYQQVEEDLLKAMPLLEQYGADNSKFRATDMFVYTLLSRMYLYMEKWDKAQQYATKALEHNSKLVNLASIPYPGTFSNPATGVYSINSKEAIWFGYASQYEYDPLSRFRPYGPVPFVISSDLQSKYQFDRKNTTNRGDLRMRYFYYWDFEDYDWTIYRAIYGQKLDQASSGVIKGMRVAELYLNRAESYIQQYLKNGDESMRTAALADLNYLRSNRYDTRNVPYVNVDYSGQPLLDFCRDERRRELSFEDHRWFDLRRYGMPEIHHTFQTTAGQSPVEYVLHQGDKRYVLPIPRSVLLKNPAMQPNP
ncbi:RagB/SusD family nutrient uptake outer membrane protein [Flavitalea sp. BT771]|uniref:RagB/SusD family nutrient uptake outer membrane protein n=1 Tax=Flavitalea sp. BT771 TaxID=3063329 RepID=UPI0026E2F82B|nr:RagB/SusD family nutrient uptake outer membrane protein [Flavitalea sp. BT771]MDO6435126.1 RagB/SusD family nutrient uptake outer membrane protein [Flavitalea sp. BT771]MDV6224169.1 RagB/SusD family nutrient uptake outer membrane protein [Flavitalea sp. BT771]